VLGSGGDGPASSSGRYAPREGPILDRRPRPHCPSERCGVSNPALLAHVPPLHRLMQYTKTHRALNVPVHSQFRNNRTVTHRNNRSVTHGSNRTVTQVAQVAGLNGARGLSWRWAQYFADLLCCDEVTRHGLQTTCSVRAPCARWQSRWDSL
jgi:hypothetical protein